ncbi:TetR/AcrR family transcriptional regulator [Amycolatopsis oliviviridis]|uniref:TetR family transcriptional regulator n=1 Tax=Amycolatopsis oliviviridis TaxID=1471590 RepID=A0ABQ3L5I9_9PSEU|nr:TetR/AcrR family transcriptional regulator [Amycolatopsis oliviviridis]GHH05843.1 TetR family transcriptional regulator [Amycolatopsis oliviviridis]
MVVPSPSGGIEDPRRASRRRGAELEQAILQATLNELLDGGYANLTIDRVAARAGTNKSAVYRRWPHRAPLAVAAYRHAAVVEDLPDTGDLRTDALALLRAAAERIASPQGEVLRILAAEIRDEPELLREARDQLVESGTRRWLTVLGRAVDRGQARPEALAPRMATVALDLLRNEYLVRDVTVIPDSTLTEIIDTIYLPLVRTHP